jgi:uncharacterized protein
MRPRLVTPLLRRRLASYPAVALVGARQCGKTTLARSLGGRYYDLEQPADRLRLDLEWEQVIASGDLLVLDEAQTWPDIFARIRGAIDAARRRMGRFLLLGSVSPALMTHVSESLAGRLSLVELTPFLLTELGRRADLDALWLRGGYPDGGLLDAAAYPQWQADYLALLTQRDLPEWGMSARPQEAARLLRMLAVAHGQAWNASRIGQSLGISYQTVNDRIDVLEGAWLVRMLQPWHANLRKRLVKSPKMYVRDTGLLHGMLGVRDDDMLRVQPWVGASWEGFCIEQVLGTLAAAGVQHQPWYFRTSDGYEIDLVLDLGHTRWAIEIKLTSSPSPSDMERLDKTADMIDVERRILVTRTSRVAGDASRSSLNLPALLRECAALTD